MRARPATATAVLCCAAASAALRPVPRHRPVASQVPAAGLFGGLSKNTWAVNEPRDCARWFLKYLPGVVREGNECPDDTCPCSQEGRVYMQNATGTGSSDDTFGVHTVNCTWHPAGACRVADIERGWQRRFAGMRGYTPLMDHNLGLWAHSLAGITAAFDRDGVAYHPMRWTDKGKAYYSVLANPCGYALIEFISDDIGDRDPGSFRAAARRMRFASWNGPHAPTPANPLGLYPIKISRATTRLDELAAYYVDVFNVTVVDNVTHPSDGARSATLLFPATSTGPTRIHLQLWQREEPRPADPAGCDDWSVAKWEQYMLAAHAAEMRGPSCGMDRWLDNHYSFDCNDAGFCDAGRFVAAYKRYGIRYRVDPFAFPPHEQRPLWFIYAYDPSGAGVEVHLSEWADPPPGLVEANPPSCIHGSYPNGTCAGELAGQCT